MVLNLNKILIKKINGFGVTISIRFRQNLLKYLKFSINTK